MTRRKILKSMAPLAAGAVVVTEKGAATSSAFELDPEKRYLLVLKPKRMLSPDAARSMNAGLADLCAHLGGVRAHGVVVSWDVDLKLYELESDENS